MLGTPGFHHLDGCIFQGLFDSRRGPVSHQSAQAQHVTSETAAGLVALQGFEFPEHRFFHIHMKDGMIDREEVNREVPRLAKSRFAMAMA